MSTKRHLIVKELDPESVTGYSANEIKHYVSLGYRPYLLENGTIKWLTAAQRTYRELRHAPRRSFKRHFQKNTSPKKARYKQRRGSSFKSFFREHWLFLLLLVSTAVIILIICKFWI